MDKKEQKIKSVEDLRKVLEEAGLPNIPIYPIPHVDDLKELLPQISDQDKRKIQLECIRQARDGKGKK